MEKDFTAITSRLGYSRLDFDDRLSYKYFMRLSDGDRARMVESSTGRLLVVEHVGADGRCDWSERRGKRSLKDFLAAVERRLSGKEAVKSSAKAGRPCMDRGLFAAACDEYEMVEYEAEGCDYYLQLPVSGTVGLGVELKSEVAVVYAVAPDGRHELCWKAYEDFRDSVDVADWFDGLQEEAYDKYVPEEEKEFIES